ncbi:oocyte zinc finger protein XlCOF6 isoform X2 [Folsomia candida]|uniref:oocyte zinc finger protein XlCOF6 isoform X2 n=1 Tax=Folsomia candida TaxID=158441 RepID=UPI001604D82B|nr:oocyte zinc finger protein XlCOF6 isoform X2 [Folsomia candida]
MAQLNCLLCLKGVDKVGDENSADNYLDQTQIIQLFELVVPKDRNSPSHQDLIANCAQENDGFTLCHDCSFATTQVEQIKGKISQLEEEINLKIEQIRRTIIHSSHLKEFSKELDQIRMCFLNCLSSDGGVIQDDFQVKVETEGDYEGMEDYEDKFLPDDKVDLSPPAADDYNGDDNDDPLLTGFSHSSSEDESSFLITPDNLVAKKKKLKYMKKKSRSKMKTTEQKALLKVSKRSKTIKKPNISISDRKTRSSSCRNNEDKPEIKYSTEANESDTEYEKKKKKSLKKPAKRRKFVFPCPICPRKFPVHVRLVKHMLGKHETNEKNYFCSKCGKGFTAEPNLQRHVSLHELDDSKPIICPVCDARFATQQHLDRHALTHERKYQCDFCPQVFHIKTNFDSHVRTHTGERPYKCEQCPEAFIDWEFLKRSIESHIELVHEGKKNHSCDECGEKFKYLETLRYHRVKAHNADGLICDTCGATYGTRKAFERHKLDHAMAFQFECDKCGLKFKAQHLLRYHMSVHGQGYICEHCSMTFKLPHHLAQHIKRIHSPDYVAKKPYECSYCKKRYQTKRDMDCHVRQVHTGERPFVCHLCGKGYAVKTTLTLHIKGVHGIDERKRSGQKKSKRDEFSTAKGREQKAETELLTS